MMNSAVSAMRRTARMETAELAIREACDELEEGGDLQNDVMIGVTICGDKKQKDKLVELQFDWWKDSSINMWWRRRTCRREKDIGGPVEDERSDKDECGAPVEVEWEGVEGMDVDCEVGAAEKVVATKTVVEEATAPLVEGTSCEVVGLDKGQVH
jgi:hypothetical protein